MLNAARLKLRAEIQANPASPTFKNRTHKGMSTQLDIQTVLAQARGVALDLSRSAVEAFEDRCKFTENACERLHFSACISRLPDGECTSNTLTPTKCLESSCGSVQDFSNPVVQIPASLQSDNNEVYDADAIEAICYGTLLDVPLVEQFKGSQSPDEASSVRTFFGSWNGVMRTFPGSSSGKECGDFDPRIRPWYVAASSGPKDVVIVVDVSASMEKNGRFELATEAVEAVLGTMTEHTFVNIVLFESNAEVLTSESLLVPATHENKDLLLNLFAQVNPVGSTDFEQAMRTTFNLLEASRALGNEASSECSTAILLLTDGEITQGLGYDDPSLVAELVETLNAEIEAQIFTFALGPEADAATLKTIACGSGGIFQAVGDGGALATAMSFYYRYYAIGLGGNTDYTANSGLYELSDGTGGGLGFTVASPAYDNSVDPPAFLGVSGVDFTLQSLLDLDFNQTEVESAVSLGGRECPAALFNLTSCQLQQFRGSISTESVCDEEDSSCGSTSASLEPTRCMAAEEYPDNLWHNDNLAGLSFLERNCCANDTYDPSLPTPTCEIAAADAESTTLFTAGWLGGVVSALLGAGLVALAVLLRRRRAPNQKITCTPSVPYTHDDDNLERDPDQSRDASSSSYTEAVSAVGNGGDMPPSYQQIISLHRDTPAEADGVGWDITLRSASASLDRPVPSSVERSEEAATTDEEGGAGLAGEEAIDHSMENSLTTTTNIAMAKAFTGNMSAAEGEELAQFHQRQGAAGAVSVSGGPHPEEASDGGTGTSSAADGQHSVGDINLRQAVLAAAQDLARSCQIPGVGEAAEAVCMVANLVTDSRGNARAIETRLRQCNTIVMALERAAEVANKGGDAIGEVALGMIEDVHGAIFDLVELIKTYQSKNKLSRLLMSTLFKRRQEELDAVVDRAVMRLQLGLQVQVGRDVNVAEENILSANEEIKDSFMSVKREMELLQSSIAQASSESVAEARRNRRQRKLEQVEIPEKDLSITDELLGKGGFGEVYLADYNGHNAAAKVLHIAQYVGEFDDNQKQRKTSQRKMFLRELDAMIRLRSPNTVNVYGAVTSLPDRMVLVMELLAGGDLLAMLEKSKTPLPEEQSKRIIRDICTGMAFLHRKNTVHGDLKSANVLLDGDGRAKIADFGTSRWTQHKNITGLATYTTKSSLNNHMSIAWSAPEVLESEGSSYESDVYSFGIVVWEVISRELPWANKARPRDILTAVLRGVRPPFHVDAPTDIVDISKACWCAEPKERTTFSAILEGIKAKSWSDE